MTKRLERGMTSHIHAVGLGFFPLSCFIVLLCPRVELISQSFKSRQRCSEKIVILCFCHCISISIY
jgi:hypothetical protein